MKGNGLCDEWAYAGANYNGCSTVYLAPTGGIYQVRVNVGVTGGGVDERHYQWSDFSDYTYGLCVAGDDKHFGVCDAEWQMALRTCAKAYIGSGEYALASDLDSMYGFTALDSGDSKCNYFVAYRIREIGLPLPVQHITYGMFSYPPTANDWASGAAIQSWRHLGGSCYIQPGYVVGHPANQHGHCGIVDFDGWVISAGERTVNRLYPEWHDGTSGYNILIGE